MEQNVESTPNEEQVPQTDTVEENLNSGEATEPETKIKDEDDIQREEQTEPEEIPGTELEETTGQSEEEQQEEKPQTEQPEEQDEETQQPGLQEGQGEHAKPEVDQISETEQITRVEEAQVTKEDEPVKSEPQSKGAAIEKLVETQTDEAAPIRLGMEDQLALLQTLSSEKLLNKHTSSFKCFEQYLCSRSELRLIENLFPPLKDPGLDEILHYIPPEEELDPDGCQKYINMCKDLKIVPMTRIIKSLATDTLNLKYYGITLSQMRGITDALKVNSNIKYLILQDNWLSHEQCVLLSEVLRESNSIRVLNLKECRIGPEGAEKLCEGISSTQFLHELDLSYNSLGDKGLTVLQSSFIENTSVKKLNLSHNELTADSGVTMEKILIENKTLEELDLAWNGFFTAAGNKKLGNGLAKNQLISWLSLAWNGIGIAAALRPITKYIRKTEVLQFLDLSWNRITAQALKLLRAALIKNKSLNHVKIGNNIYTPDEADFLLAVFAKQTSDNLENLDMENMCVTKDFLKEKIRHQKRQKTITHGHVLSNYEIHGPDINKLVFARCKYLAMKPKKKKLRKDFGHFILSLPDKHVTTQTFEELLKKKKIKKIDKDLLKELMARFPHKKKIDCVAMKEAYMKLYPDTVLPEEKKKKGKKGKKGKKKEKKE
ncbi:uncharacterized protein LOC135134339 isoform X2 [Zophobas morio]|uniref:uncharacterized protein LOC135134339 isoform X2 n=1 Tax=Zophobas morio TaxID=2755281 RepID=UPI003083111F